MATKKPVTKKASAKKKSVVRTKKVAPLQSFKLSKADRPFFTFALTQQTLYWAIISGAVLALGLWIVTIQVNVNNIYDQIEMNSTLLEDMPAPKVTR